MRKTMHLLRNHRTIGNKMYLFSRNTFNHYRTLINDVLNDLINLEAI